MEGDRWFELKRNGCPEWWVIQQSGSTLLVKYVVRRYLYTMPVMSGTSGTVRERSPRTRVMNFVNRKAMKRRKWIFSQR